MTPSTFSVVALLLLGCSCQAQTDARLLYAIGQVEGGSRLQRGDSGKALGLYQTHPEAWADANFQLAAEGRQTYPLRSPSASPSTTPRRQRHPMLNVWATCPE